MKPVIDTLGDLLSYLNPFSENFAFKGIGDILGNIFSFLNPFSDNFILSGVLDFLGNMLNYINPFSDDFILNDANNFLGYIFSFLNPFDENFIGYKFIELLSDLFNFLFVPDDDCFNQFTDIFNTKLGFVTNIQDDVNDIKALLGGGEVSTLSNSAPYLSFNVNSKYYSGDLMIIDLSWYQPFKPFVDVILGSFMIIFLIVRLFVYLPSIIQASGAFGIVTYSESRGGKN